MTKNVFNPIYVSITGTPYTYKDYIVSINNYFTFGSEIVDELYNFYNGSAFLNKNSSNVGEARVKLDDVLIDEMNKYGVEFLKNNTGYVNGETKTLEVNTSELVKVGVRYGSDIEYVYCCSFYDDGKYYLSKIPTDSEFLWWRSWLYDGSGSVKEKKSDGTTTTKNTSGLLSKTIVDYVDEDVLMLIQNNNTVMKKEDDCSIRYYMTFRMKNGRTYCKGFTNGVKGYSSKNEEIENIDRQTNIIHKDVKETLTLNTNMLIKNEYNILCEAAFSGYVLVYDKVEKTNCWYKVSSSSFNELSSKKKTGDYFTISLEKVEYWRY